MTSLLFCGVGEKVIIRKIGGDAKIKKYFEQLGFTYGAEISLVAKSHERFIVKVRDTRLALDSKSAGLIFI